MLAHVAPGVAGELTEAPLDRLLAGANRERRHQPALKRQDAPLGDHALGQRKRLPGRELADGLLKQNGAQLARLERRGALGQALLDAILERTPAGPALAPACVPGCSWPAVKSKRAAVSFQTRCRSPRVTSTLALRFSSLSARSSPRSGARPHFARKRSAALATSRLREEKASSSPRGTPAISK